MTNEEKILEMLGTMQDQMNGMQDQMNGMQNQMNEMQSDLRGVKSEITKLHGKIDTLTAAHEETRGAVNAIVDWTDRVSEVYELPLPKL